MLDDSERAVWEHIADEDRKRFNEEMKAYASYFLGYLMTYPQGID